MMTEIGPGTEDNSRQGVDDAAMPMLMMPVCSGVNNTFGYWMDDHFCCPLGCINVDRMEQRNVV